MIKLYNDDCMKVMQNLVDEGVKVDLILCDLPYGTLGKNPPSTWKTRDVISDWDSVLNTEDLFTLYSKLLKNKGRAIVFAQAKYTAELILQGPRDNITFCQHAIWLKDKGGNILGCNKQLVHTFEDILIFNKRTSEETDDEFVFNKGNQNMIASVFKCGKDNSNFHPTQKPVALLKQLISIYTNDGAIVLDNCMGSGSTGVACRELNRDFIGIELNPDYFKIAEGRINNFKKTLF